MTLPRFFLLGFGFLSLVFGLAYLLAPAALTEPAGFGELSATAMTDVRATYGGFQIGMGAFLVWAARAEERHKGALVLVALSIGAVFFSRLAGLALDGELNEFHASGLVTESILTALTLFVLYRTQRAA
ncbi:MAG: hypothetical protein CL908_16510 [Deltaproteobacteria bacterium]|nr:hypothetical protein [Deltaproteobacteria bacterium]